MTGVQANEDQYKKKEAVPGKSGQKEFNYIRHGVLAVIAFLTLLQVRCVYHLLIKQEQKRI